MRILVIGFVLALMTGCAAMKTTYNPSGAEESDLAKIVTLNKEYGVDAGNYNAWIEKVRDSSGAELTGRNDLAGGRIGSFSMIPGEYEIQAVCVRAYSQANLKVKVKVEASKTYRMYCSIGKGENIFGMTVDAYATMKFEEL